MSDYIWNVKLACYRCSCIGDAFLFLAVERGHLCPYPLVTMRLIMQDETHSWLWVLYKSYIHTYVRTYIFITNKGNLVLN